ncbi:guided entry of tail-anchored proteins factor 1 [Aspergillus affinis]|uniref:guided entry of tail-anchored proteins factor 1 n=1 Tax=Aspergillus affinis TaxID=1070780 RepID=UPI0022FDEB89|nr:protein get1 [Aspergillus affinis]KAI9038490.1 protein get1 [Aspergillus affinis]
MLSLIWTVFFVHVAIYLVNTIGASTIDNLLISFLVLQLWILYVKLPTPTSNKAREANRLKREALQLKREMNNTSSQDEFAKWAKLRRRHDKTMEEYEEMTLHVHVKEPGTISARWDANPGHETQTDKALSAQNSSFEWSVKIARWLSTNGLKIFLQFWYSKTPVFALPEAWVPYYVAWILSFPRAPMGSVSIQVWSNVCATAISALAEIVTIVGQAAIRKGRPAPAATAQKTK